MSYFEKNHDDYFQKDLDMMEWLRQFSESTDDTFIRGFLGRMLFSGDEVFKKIGVLSTSEKGWTKELNMVSWNGRPAKYDIS